MSNEGWENVTPIPPSEVQSGAYLLHFSREVPYEKSKLYGDSRHYVGASTDIFHRVARHKAGLGSQMTRKAYELGIDIVLAGIFPGAKPRYLESIVTKVGATKFCPICSETDFIQIKKDQDAERSWNNIHPKAKQNITAWQRKRKSSE